MNNKKIISVIAVIMAVLMLASLVVSMIPVSAFADEPEGLSDLKAQKEQLSNQVKDCMERLQALKDQQANVLEQKAALDEQKKLANEQLKIIAKEIDQCSELIAEKAKEVDAAKNKEERQLERYRGRVRAMEERGTVSYWSVLFQSSSFEELLGAMDFISEVMEADQRVIDDLRVLQAQIAEKQQTLETSLAEQQSAKEALAVKNNELRDQRTEATGLIKEMEENEADYKDVLAEIEAEEEKTQKEIVRLSKELAAQQGNTTVTYGGYIWPVTTSKRVTSPFGKRNTGIKGASTYHEAIDIANSYGTPIYASDGGTVTYSGWRGGYGYLVIIDHGNGYQTYYGHNSSLVVSVGEHVYKGQQIARMGSTGVSSGNHCHFGILINGTFVNPLNYL